MSASRRRTERERGATPRCVRLGSDSPASLALAFLPGIACSDTRNETIPSYLAWRPPHHHASFGKQAPRMGRSKAREGPRTTADDAFIVRYR